jgi:hypothetical protein
MDYDTVLCCSLLGDYVSEHFGRTYASIYSVKSLLKTEALLSSETLVYIYLTKERRHNVEYQIIYRHHYENFKSYKHGWHL